MTTAAGPRSVGIRQVRARAGRLLVVLIAVFLAGCATTRRGGVPESEPLNGVASWYGEEFAGRTTANGEIFDPQLLTAAHRTLPFGTIVQVTNPKTQRSVRVRINDRGPWIQNRLIDLSWAAAREIGLVEPGIGEVNLAVIRLGSGDREPPAPFDVATGNAPPNVPAVAIPDALPPVEPAPQAAPVEVTAVPEVPVIVDRVEVEEVRAGVPVRRQVAADGKTIETVPIEEKPAVVPPPRAKPVPAAGPPPQQEPPAAVPVKPPARPPPERPRAVRGFIVQVGAFAGEANANALRESLASIGIESWIEQGELYRVRIGPFPTQEKAIEMRERLETRGVSAIIVRE